MTTKVTSTPAHTKPAQSVMAAGEVKEYIYNAINDLGAEQAIANPTVTLTTYGTDTVVTGGATLDSPSVEGTNIFIRVANIVAKSANLLTITFDHVPPRVDGEHTVRFHVIDGA